MVPHGLHQTAYYASLLISLYKKFALKTEGSVHEILGASCIHTRLLAPFSIPCLSWQEKVLQVTESVILCSPKSHKYSNVRLSSVDRPENGQLCACRAE